MEPTARLLRLLVPFGVLLLCAAAPPGFPKPTGSVGSGTGEDAQVILGDMDAVTRCYRFARSGTATDRAISTCTRAIEASARHPFNRTASTVNRGVVLYNAAEYARAIEDFGTAIDVYRTRNPKVFVNRGLAYESAAPGDAAYEARARADYEAALALSPEARTAKRRLEALERPYLERRDRPQRVIS